MKSSNLFSDYMMSSSVNRSIRSINNSPTSGIIQKQKSSYGPSLTIINKSRDESMFKETRAQTNQPHVERILLLTMQISRLQAINENLVKQSSQELRSSRLNMNKQLSMMKQSNESLKIAIKTLQGSLMKCEEEKSNLKMTYQQRVSQLQLQVKTFELKMSQTQKQLERIRKQKHDLQLEIQRMMIESTKQSISQSRMLHYESQKQKEIELTYEILSLKEELNKLKIVISQQENVMGKLKRENQIFAQRQIQLLRANQEYAEEFEQIKKRNQIQSINMGVMTDLQGKKIERYEQSMDEFITIRQEMSQMTYQLNSVRKELQQKTKQGQEKSAMLERKQQQLAQKSQQLKDKLLIIAQLKVKSDNLRQKHEKLSNHATERQFWSNRKIQTLQQDLKEQIKEKQTQIRALKQNILELTEQNDTLKTYISQQAETIRLKQLEYSSQNIELENKLKRAQRKLKNVQKSSSINKNTQNIYNTTIMPETRLFKSRSIESTSFFSNRKNMVDVNLESIVTATVDLQSSNERSLRLINKSQQKLMNGCLSPIKSKRKIFVKLNESRSGNDSEISFEQGKTTRYKQRTARKNDDNMMKSSIHEYYGLENN